MNGVLSRLSDNSNTNPNSNSISNAETTKTSSSPPVSPAKSNKAWSDIIEPESIFQSKKSTPNSIVKHKYRTPETTTSTVKKNKPSPDNLEEKTSHLPKSYSHYVDRYINYFQIVFNLSYTSLNKQSFLTYIFIFIVLKCVYRLPRNQAFAQLFFILLLFPL